MASAGRQEDHMLMCRALLQAVSGAAADAAERAGLPCPEAGQAEAGARGTAEGRSDHHVPRAAERRPGHHSGLASSLAPCQ